MHNDSVKATGKPVFVLTGADGNVKQIVEIPNMVVSIGKSFIASRMVDVSNAIMSHMAVGTGTIAAATGDVILGNEIGRVALTSYNRTNNVISYVATFPAGVGTGAITEAGIFNDPTDGTMLARTVFGTITKGPSDTLTVTWNITIN